MIDQAKIEPKPVLSHMSSNVRRIATFGLMTGFLCSCTAITNPYVTLGENSPVAPSFHEAAEFAQKKAKEFDDRADDLAQFDLITGGSIFASAIAGLGFAAFGAHTDAILGAGLAAGTSSGARSFIPYSQRIDAYKMGSGALHCAVTAIGLGVLAPSDSNPNLSKGSEEENTEPVKKKDKEPGKKVQSRDLLHEYLRDLPEAQPSQGSNAKSRNNLDTVELMPMAEVMAKDALSTGDSRLIADTADVKAEIRQFNRATLKVQAAAKNLKAVGTAASDNRAQRLMGATRVIIEAVAGQITAARLDPDAAVKQLKTQSSAMAKQIREAAAALEKAAVELEEKQEDIEEAINNAASEAGKGKAANISSDALTLKSGVKQTSNQVAVWSAAAKRILALVELDTSCLGNSES